MHPPGHRTGLKGQAARDHGFPHGAGHAHRILGLGDGRVHEDALASEFHRLCGVRSRSHSRVDENRDARLMQNEFDIVGIENPQSGSDGRRERHDRPGTGIGETPGQNRIVRRIDEHEESFLGECFRGPECLESVGIERSAITYDLKLDQGSPSQQFASLPGRADRFWGSPATRRVGQDGVTGLRKIVEEARAISVLPDVDAADGNRDDLCPARLDRIPGLLKITIFSGANQKTGRIRPPRQLPQVLLCLDRSLCLRHALSPADCVNDVDRIPLLNPAPSILASGHDFPVTFKSHSSITEIKTRQKLGDRESLANLVGLAVQHNAHEHILLPQARSESGVCKDPDPFEPGSVKFPTIAESSPNRIQRHLAMTLALVGLNHQNASLSQREPLAVSPTNWIRELHRMQDATGVAEAILLSTCNRTEIYYRTGSGADHPLDPGRKWFMGLAPERTGEIEPLLYGYEDLAVARHLLRVATSLDSEVIGEPQILGQIKEAYEVAHQSGFVGQALHGLFQFVFLAAKQIRQDSGVGLHPVSIASLSVRLSEEIFDDFPARTALLIGAGDTMQLVSHHLSRLHLSRLIVANRSLERARQLAQPQGGYAITLDEIPAHLAEADLIFAAAQVTEPVLTAQDLRAALERRRHAPVFIMDLGLPRNVDPTAATLPAVFLYTLDHLESLARENRRERYRAAETAEQAIERAVAEHASNLKGRMATPTICALRERAQKTRQDTLQQARQLLSHGESPESALDFLAHTLTNRLLHLPTVQLREAAQEGRENLILAARDLFGLEEDLKDPQPNDTP